MRSLTMLALLLGAAPAAAAPLDPAMINRIADQALNHGEVVDTVAYLTDRIGPRLTNSPGMRAAERWTQQRFRDWGLADVRTEGFQFGRGWSIESSSVRMIAPRPLALRAIPITWTPATEGALTAPIIVAPMKREADFEQWRGKLAGKIVLVSYPAPPRDATDPRFSRLSDADIAKLDVYVQPTNDEKSGDGWFKMLSFAKKLDAFLKSEGALAWARMSSRDGGLVHGNGYLHRAEDTPALPGIEIAAEDYRRLARLAKAGEVRLEIDSRVRFDDSDSKGYNILADLPGTDPKAGYVMAGAHLDSWVAGDGAADNAAGSAVVMEAARILSTLKVRPKRTIRFALWSGEEQGLYGSAAYLERHLATRPASPDPAKAALGYDFKLDQYPLTKLPGYDDLAGYFNIDNGSGKLRGIYAENNLAAAPMLREWLAPFASMGAATVVARPTGGTDHQYLSAVGLPAFQFIQDPLDYGTMVHHTNVDTFDHLRAEDLRQAAVILASVLLSAANSDKALPAMPLPTRPKLTDPFSYEDPDQRD
ncbi:M20/M25/M40 family metallo-hydrolase [Sphingosinicella sp. BN140058]|uniref:M20/M25/M40 family metallo-hydrolase n=1 Tax=Sphingosinicella sp. BN140058 TaxID=1892855 RepID=UPI0010121971|nr:M20/M25/M40 family metallo-hydrolase [Sphingosinicella sp. BN140058]QAY75330.1 M20/M25/M40 family metallo-hydrolase [Sphingosinicella sp. BN140058]